MLRLFRGYRVLVILFRGGKGVLHSQRAGTAHFDMTLSLRMIFSENRLPLFGIMRQRKKPDSRRA
jgi:hypothetical protein